MQVTQYLDRSRCSKVTETMHKQTNFYYKDPSDRQLFSTGASHLNQGGMFRLKQASALLKLKKPRLTVVPGVGVEEVFINGTGKKMVKSMACYSTTEVECNCSFKMQNGAACAHSPGAQVASEELEAKEEQPAGKEEEEDSGTVEDPTGQEEDASRREGEKQKAEVVKVRTHPEPYVVGRGRPSNKVRTMRQKIKEEAAMKKKAEAGEKAKIL